MKKLIYILIFTVFVGNANAAMFYDTLLSKLVPNAQPGGGFNASYHRIAMDSYERQMMSEQIAMMQQQRAMMIHTMVMQQKMLKHQMQSKRSKKIYLLKNTTDKKSKN